MAKKKKDFDKQKLKVGKGKLERANATDTSFTAKSIHLPSQSLGKDVSLQSQLNLTRHHQAIARRQAVLALSDMFLDEPSSRNLIIDALAALVVDEDRQVRDNVLKFTKQLDPEVLVSFVNNFLLYIHSAMTHINPDIRAESTRYLDALLEVNPQSTLRLGFAKTLRLFFPLLGWRLDTQTQADSVSISLGFGKSAARTRLAHLQSLYRLVTLGLADDKSVPPILFHDETYKFLCPPMSNPFAAILSGSADGVVTDDVEARQALVQKLAGPLKAGLATNLKEGGEMGRLAGKLSTVVSNGAAHET